MLIKHQQLCRERRYSSVFLNSRHYMKRSSYVYAQTAETSGEESRELNELKAGVPAVGLDGV
jgi:hypothetical protein